jgi:hypothetical protein
MSEAVAASKSFPIKEISIARFKGSWRASRCKPPLAAKPTFRLRQAKTRSIHSYRKITSQYNF